LKTSGKGDARFPVAPPVFFARLVTALRSFRRSLLGASPFPLSPAHPWRIDDLAQQRLGHQTAPVCPLRGSQLQKSTVVPDQRLFPINGCSRSTVVPDRRLFPIDGCSRSTVVPDQWLFPIDGCSRSMVVPDRRLFPIDGCSRSTVVPDRRLFQIDGWARQRSQKEQGFKKYTVRDTNRPAENTAARLVTLSAGAFMQTAD